MLKLFKKNTKITPNPTPLVTGVVIVIVGLLGLLGVEISPETNSAIQTAIGGIVTVVGALITVIRGFKRKPNDTPENTTPND